MSHLDIEKVEDARNCNGCDNVVLSVAFKTGHRTEVGCRCDLIRPDHEFELGGES
jgi:hypothetical protein